MEDLFNQMDKDKSGDVSLEELKYGLKDLGLRLTSVSGFCCKAAFTTVCITVLTTDMHVCKSRGVANEDIWGSEPKF